MHRIILVVAVVLGFAGCTYVNSAAGGNTAQTNGTWFTEVTGLGPFLPFSARVYYCPPPGGGGAATCTEAEMVEGGATAPAGGMAAPAAPTPPPAPEGDMGGEDGMEGMEGIE